MYLAVLAADDGCGGVDLLEALLYREELRGRGQVDLVGMELKVEGLGLRIEGSGFRVWV